MKKSIHISLFLLLAITLFSSPIPDNKTKSHILEYDTSTLDKDGLAQLNYFLQIPGLVEKINSMEGTGNTLKKIRRRMARILKQAASAEATVAQKNYLTALAGDVTANNFTSSTALWMELEQRPVHIIIRPAGGPEKKNLEVFILIEHNGFTERAKKYSTILDKMLENIPKNEGAVIIEQERIFPILVVDLVYCTNPPLRFTSIFPAIPAKGGKQKNKILIFHNLLLAHFEHIIKPVAEKILGEKRAVLANFTTYVSNIIMHRLAHFTGPIFLERQSEKPVTVQEELKEYFPPVEEIRADAAAIFNSKILVDEKFFTEEEAKTIPPTYIVSLLADLKYNPEDSKKKPSLLLFNYLLKNDAISLDINEKRIKIQIDKFNIALKKLLGKVTQIESLGSYTEAALFMEKDKNVAPSDELNMIRKKLKKIPLYIKVTGFKAKTPDK